MDGYEWMNMNELESWSTGTNDTGANESGPNRLRIIGTHIIGYHIVDSHIIGAYTVGPHLPPLAQSDWVGAMCFFFFRAHWYPSMCTNVY